MSKILKPLVGLAVIALLGLGLYKRFQETFVPQKEFSEDHDFESAAVTSVDVASKAVDISLRPATDGKFHVHFHGWIADNAPVAMQAAVNGDTLVIKTNDAQDVDAKHLQLSTGSRSSKLVLEVPAGFAGALHIATVSGDIDVAVNSATLDTKSVSGDLKMVGAAKQLHANSVSGDVELAMNAPFGQLDVDTVSGDTSITVPPAFGIALDATSVSGDLSAAAEFTHEDGTGHKSLRGKSGDGAAAIHAHSVSGDFKLERAK